MRIAKEKATVHLCQPSLDLFEVIIGFGQLSLSVLMGSQMDPWRKQTFPHQQRRKHTVFLQHESQFTRKFPPAKLQLLLLMDTFLLHSHISVQLNFERQNTVS